jgi:hypothetical protein
MACSCVPPLSEGLEFSIRAWQATFRIYPTLPLQRFPLNLTEIAIRYALWGIKIVEITDIDFVWC